MLLNANVILINILNMDILFINLHFYVIFSHDSQI